MSPDLVVCSLEAWDEVWRRNQFLVSELLEIRGGSRVLFVAPPVDRLQRAVRRSSAGSPGLSERQSGRVWELVPSKVWPRVAGPYADRSLFRQVCRAAETLQFDRPMLWVNDSVYAGLAIRTAWPTVYDITDDWLRLPLAPRELRRRRVREASLLANAEEVVVCSDSLARDRGKDRRVHLIPNAVDQPHFRRPRARPEDLPDGAVAVYVGTLHEERIDLDLIAALAEAEPETAVVLVGPNCLSAAGTDRLTVLGNVCILGPRPYADVPAYLQHATVVIVPHRVTPFTESLDPIKAYECDAVGAPTVATPVPGFLADRGTIRSVPPADWVTAVRRVLDDPPAPMPVEDLPTWRERALAFDEVLSLATVRNVRRLRETAP